MDAGEEIVREERLQPEMNAKVLVFVFGFGHAADDEHGDVGCKVAQLGDELRAVHARHDVVGNDEVDGGGIFVIAELIECAFGTEDSDDEVSGSLEDGLTRGCLNGIVVDEKQGSWHDSLRPRSILVSAATRRVSPCQPI